MEEQQKQKIVDVVVEELSHEISEIRKTLTQQQQPIFSEMIQHIADIEADLIREKDDEKKKKLVEALKYAKLAMETDLEYILNQRAITFLENTGYILGVILYTAGRTALKMAIGI